MRRTEAGRRYPSRSRTRRLHSIDVGGDLGLAMSCPPQRKRKAASASSASLRRAYSLFAASLPEAAFAFQTPFGAARCECSLQSSRRPGPSQGRSAPRSRAIGGNDRTRFHRNGMQLWRPFPAHRHRRWLRFADRSDAQWLRFAKSVCRRNWFAHRDLRLSSPDVCDRRCRSHTCAREDAVFFFRSPRGGVGRRPGEGERPMTPLHHH